MNTIDFSDNYVQAINEIAAFLATRDIEELSEKALMEKYGVRSADTLILLGSAIVYNAELSAKAYKSGIAGKIMIVGGIGHSTEYLRENIRNSRYSEINVDNRSEADMICDIMVNYFDIDRKNIIIENKSTNCGENAREAYKVAKMHNLNRRHVILLQDPTMQLRTYAGFMHEWREEGNVKFVNFSPFIPKVVNSPSGFDFVQKGIEGIWDIDRFLSLITGEIPRLMDNAEGYGPKGRGFIAHVDVPMDVLEAYEKLKPLLATYEEKRVIK